HHPGARHHFRGHQHPGRCAAGADRPAHPPLVHARPGKPMSLQDTIAVRPVAEALQRAQAGKGYWARVRKRLLADRITMTVRALLACIIVMVLAAPLIATHDPAAGTAFARLKSPGYQGHWLGTDEVGRDLWSRILYGGRLSLLCGVAPVAFALLVGGSLGLIAGYRGGIGNSLLLRSLDVLFALPSILLATAICRTPGSGVRTTSLP